MKINLTYNFHLPHHMKSVFDHLQCKVLEQFNKNRNVFPNVVSLSTILQKHEISN